MSNIAVLNLNSDVYSKSLFCENIKISQIVNSKYLQKDSNGDIVGVDAPSANNIVNSQIDANANIDRSKIAPDNFNKGSFLWNDKNTGLISASDMFQTLGDNTFYFNVGLQNTAQFQCKKLKLPYFFMAFEHLETTDDTQTALFSYDVDTNSSAIVEIKVHALQNTDKYFSCWTGKAICRYKATDSLAVSNIYDFFSDIDSNMSNCLVEVQAYNNTFQLMVTGLPSTSINWSCQVNYSRSI